MSRALLVGAIALLLGGCVIDDLAAAGRPCSSTQACGPGTVCNPASGRCIVRNGGTDGGGGGNNEGGAPRDGGGETPTFDQTVPDTVGPDIGSDGGVPPATCNNNTKLVLKEVAVGDVDYVVVFNLGAATAELKGYTLYMSGNVGGSRVRALYTFSTSRKLIPGQGVYVFEKNAGAGPDVNIGAAMPFDPNEAASVSLFDGSSNLVDYVAIGAKINLPMGAAFDTNAIKIVPPSNTQSYQRDAYKGKCPTFFAADWVIKTKTR